MEARSASDSVTKEKPPAEIGTFRRDCILQPTLADAQDRIDARANGVGAVERRITFPGARLDVEVRDGSLLFGSDKFALCVTLESDAEREAFGRHFENNCSSG